MRQVKVYDRLISWKLPERVRAGHPMVRVDLLDAPTVCRLISYLFEAEYDVGWIDQRGSYAIVGIPKDDELGFPVTLVRLQRRTWEITEYYSDEIRHRAETHIKGMFDGTVEVTGLALSRGVIKALRERGCAPYRGNGGAYLVPVDVDITDVIEAIQSHGGEARVVQISK